MAWLGARVIHVQRPPDGDPMRAVPPLIDGRISRTDNERIDGISNSATTMTSYGSAALERGKHVVMIDLQTADGRRNAHELCAGADVVVESFRPGAARSGRTKQPRRR
jgi:crotonobetainyl-CoA:carnitine CoA-transferase CaiB-like acyl-CoA transferase